MARITVTFYDGFEESEIDNDKSELRVLLKDFSRVDLQDLVSINFFENGTTQRVPIPSWLNTNAKYLPQEEYIRRYQIFCNMAKKLGVEFRHSED